MYTLKYFVFPCPVSSNWHTTFVACVCVCVVCSYLTHKGNADIQHSLLMFKTKLVLLLKSNASCCLPLSVTLPRVSPPTQNLFTVQMSFFLLLIHLSNHVTFDFMFVFSCQTAMHAFSVYRMECLNYLLTKKKNHVLSKICLYEVHEGALSSIGYFFPCVWENVCACQNKKLHIFKSFLDQDCSHFFPPCKYFYSLCEVVFELMLCTSQCQK